MQRSRKPLLASGIALVCAAVLSAPAARVAASTSSSSEVRVVAGAAPDVPAALGATDLGAAPSDLQMTVDLNLPIRNADLFAQDVEAVQTPGSPLYKRQFSSQVISDLFAPAPSAVASLTQFAETSGLRANMAGNLGPLQLRGPASAMSRAFSTTFHAYREPSGIVWANRTPAALPASVAGLISGVVGLNTSVPTMHSQAQCPRSASRAVTGARPAVDMCGSDGVIRFVHLRLRQAVPRLRIPIVDPSIGLSNGPGGHHVANDLLALQQGAGTIGIMSYAGFDPADANQFWTQDNGLTTVPGITTTIASGSPSTAPCDRYETTLDVEWSGGVAPLANIHVYEAGNLVSDAEALFSRVASDNSVDEVSLSWSESYDYDKQFLGSAYLSSIHQSISQMVLEGITFITGTGDQGAWESPASGFPENTGVNWPSSDPNALAIGGSSGHVTAPYDGSENGWSCPDENLCVNGLGGSNGGTNTDYSRPAYQTGTGDFANGRNVPDVSLHADPNRDAYDTVFEGVDQSVGGVSVSGPIWAGILAVYKQFASKGASQHSLNPAGPTPMYASWHLTTGTGSTPNQAAFHDLVVGDNGLYTCGVGYDRVTGIGSPDALNLFVALKQQND